MRSADRSFACIAPPWARRRPDASFRADDGGGRVMGASEDMRAALKGSPSVRSSAARAPCGVDTVEATYSLDPERAPRRASAEPRLRLPAMDTTPESARGATAHAAHADEPSYGWVVVWG